MIKTGYKTVGSRNLTGGMSDALSNVYAMLNASENEKLERERLAKQDARQAQIDAQNKQLFDMKIVEADRALEKEQALENLNKGLLSLPTTKTGPDRLIKGTPQSSVDAATQRLVDQKLGGDPNVKGDYGAGGVYADEFARLTNTRTEVPDKPIPADYVTSTNYGVKKVQNPMTYAVTDQFYDKETGKVLVTDPTSKIGRLLYGDKYESKSVLKPREIPGLPTEEAHKLALAKAGLSDNMKATDVLTKQEMASLPKATADRIEKGKTVSLNDKQMLEAQKNYIRGQVSAGNIPANIGVARLEELEKDGVSAATQLSMLRFQRDLKKDQLSLQKEAQKIAKEAREKAAKLNKERLSSDKTLSKLQDIYNRFGSPGSSDEVKIQEDILSIKNKYGLTDSDTAALLNQVETKYKAPWYTGPFNVNEDALAEELEKILKNRK